MKNPKVAIITSTFNQEENLKKCLISLRKNANYSNYKMYFIDDSGTGKIAKKIKQKFPWVDVSANSKNEGYSTSNNKLIKKAIRKYNPDYILHIDDDTLIIDKNWLKELISFAETDKRIGIVGCKLIYPDGNLQWFYKGKKINFIKNPRKIEETKDTFETHEVTNVIGACFLIKRNVINKIGLLDEKFNPAYGEETDFCLRAGKRGFKLFYFGKVKIIHIGGSSTKHVKDWIWQIKKRNSIRLEWLNMNIFQIIKYTLVHFGSAIINNNPLKKLKMLIKAYKENFDNIKEIKDKRKERNNWKKII
jgi:GT2 family glycosyltransferase